MRSFLEVKPAPVGDPWWLEAVESFRHATPDELPAGYADGYVFETPVIDTSRYLPYLMQVFQQEGGLITRETVTTLGDALTEYPIVINCSGLGARELVGDRDIHAGRGQTIRIKQKGFQRVIVDDEGPNKLAYIVPRTSDIILGGVDEENNENTSIIPEQNSGILQRCANLAPQFANLKPEDILSVQCGLRPLRSRIRLEAERPVPDRLLVHNYGHGGSGVTLSWGCATEVVTLVKQHTA
uniref:D-amino-acid oxidase n=1 Tax=Thermosporothrix sp. COM3 TaxID=2490863 RepID=A0A455SVC7_9CHLR|nr:hypothetical protein KTC_58200 [Thermosporothrix sp. COM3]